MEKIITIIIIVIIIQFPYTHSGLAVSQKSTSLTDASTSYSLSCQKRSDYTTCILVFLLSALECAQHNEE
jgi:hypothetical protein